MWSKIKPLAVALLFAASGAVLAEAGAMSICPVAAKDRVVQISIFDGKPEELAYLAPDDGQGAANRYTLGYIYDKGGLVTVECKYKSGQTRSIELKDRVAGCEYRESKAHGPRLVCR